jgi:RNA polymerase sigma-70 factor, ECF subfamily
METDPAVRELLARARAGDRTALGKLLENYRGYLQGLAEKLLDHRASARIDPSDVVQQTCLSVHKRISEFEGQDPAQFGAWVRQIHERNVRDVVRDGLRAQKRAIAREERLPDGDVHAARQSTASQQIVRGEETARLTRAISKLPPDEQEVLRRRYLQGQPLIDVARDMGMTKDALLWLMKRAMNNVKRQMIELE